MLLHRVRYAGFWRRLVAALIDMFLLTVLLGIVLGPGHAEASIGSLMWFLENALSMAITVAFWVRFLGTPGKLLMGCQVVDADSAKPVTVTQGALRYLGYYISALPLGLGFFWIAWDKRKQGFHDKIANTVVLYDANLETDDESQKSLEQLIREVR
jgi:uncharacterized RDD family membrane protein YckC